MNHDAHVFEYYAHQARKHFAWYVSALLRNNQAHAKLHRHKSDIWFRKVSPTYDSLAS